MKGHDDMTDTYFATKYDSAVAEVIATLADQAEGYGGESFGDVESPTGYVETVALDDSMGDYAGELARAIGLTAEDIRGWHIVTTNSQGFVTVDTYASEPEWRDAIGCLERVYAAWDDDTLNPA